MKIIHPRGKAGYVELDPFIEAILEQYRKMSQKATDNIAELFFSADVFYMQGEQAIAGLERIIDF